MEEDRGIEMAFEEQKCCVCFVKFGVPIGYTNARRNDKSAFFCPNGHSMSYKESEADKLRLERDRLAQQLAYKDDEIARQKSLREGAERSASARKGQVTKMKNRVAAGVCPCCNRSFENLHRHMTTKHPTFTAEEVL